MSAAREPHDKDNAPWIVVDRDHCPSPHSFGNKLGRVAWSCVWLLLFRPSPRLLFGWRRLLLRLFGARIGRNARISPSVRVWAPWNLSVGSEASIAHDVDCYCVAPVSVGDHATVSQGAMLCTASHDVSDPHMGLTMAPIVIAAQAWVCARVFVSPGVTVGEGAVAGACSVVTRSIPAWMIAAGNPARVLRPRVLTTTSAPAKRHRPGRPDAEPRLS